jgi:hypothetical protein
MKNPPSKIIQIQVMFVPEGVNNGDCNQLVALCEDGSVWGQWHSMGYSNVPSDGEWFNVVEAHKPEVLP